MYLLKNNYSPLLEYKGDLFEDKDGLERESQYGQENEGCFLYMFRHSGTNIRLESLFAYLQKSNLLL